MTDKNEFHMPLLMSSDKAAEIILKGIKKEKRIYVPLDGSRRTAIKTATKET